MSTGGGLDMHVQPTEIVGRKGVFRITLLNQMNQPVDVVLAARDNEDGLRFRIEPEDAVIVPAGELAGPITVRVVPKVRTLMGEPHPYEIEFDGLTPWSEDESTPALVQRAHFTYVPRYTPRLLPLWLRQAPGWALLLPLVLLIPLLIFVGARTLASPSTRVALTPTPAPPRVVPVVQPPGPRAPAQGRVLSPSIPSIRRLGLVHRHQGRPYELMWQTSNATDVMLDGRPVAAQGAMVLYAPLHSALYRLVAANGVRRARASLRVVVDALTTDPHAFVLRTPEIVAFAVRRRHGKLYAIWLVRNAVHVQLQGRPVAGAGERPVPPGASTLRLTAANDVGSRQRVLHVAPPGQAATPTRRPTMTATARPSRVLIVRPTATPRPTATFAPLPTWTPVPTSTPAPPPTTTYTPRPTATPTPVSVTPGPTSPPVAAVRSTPTAVPVICCRAQP